MNAELRPARVRVHYSYRDADNFKAARAVTCTNPAGYTLGEIDAGLHERLHAWDQLIPELVGWDALGDGDWHDYDSIDAAADSGEPAGSIDEVFDALDAAAASGWGGRVETAATSTAVCEHCHPGHTVAGTAAGLVVAVDRDGTWKLFVEPCHSGDLLVTFNQPPAPNPVPDDDELDECDPELAQASFCWVDVAQHELDEMALAAKFGLRGTWQLVNDLRRAGYDPDTDGDAGTWLYHRIGLVVAAHLARQ